MFFQNYQKNIRIITIYIKTLTIIDYHQNKYSMEGVVILVIIIGFIIINKNISSKFKDLEKTIDSLNDRIKHLQEKITQQLSVVKESKETVYEKEVVKEPEITEEPPIIIPEETITPIAEKTPIDISLG